MIYLVEGCIKVVDGEVVPICGGWCCRMLNFTRFPRGRWYSDPCQSWKKGLCTCYDERPLACVGSPFYDGDPSSWPVNKFITPWCAYRKQVLDVHDVQYVILPTANECISRYTSEGLGDFERWTERRYYNERTVNYERFTSPQSK